MADLVYRPERPICALPANGVECQISAKFMPFPLIHKQQLNHNVYVFTFGLPDASQPLNLRTCSCILATLNPNAKPEEQIVRAYTPVSTNLLRGRFQLMIKIYEDGKLTPLLESMEPKKAQVFFKQIPMNIKIPYQPKGVGFTVAGKSVNHVGIIVGGTGITPMIQVLNALLGDEVRADREDVRVHMLFGNNTQKDLLCDDILDHWVNSEELNLNAKLSVEHILAFEPADSGWQGKRGFINQEIVLAAQEDKFPKPEDDCIIFVCGPPGLYNAISGPRGPDGVYGGLLMKMGYPQEKVYKF